MSLLRWENAGPVMVNLAVLLFLGFLLWLIYFGPGQAVSLEISGQSMGQGVHCLNFAGNVSASLIQGMNNSTWQVLAGGRP